MNIHGIIDMIIAGMGEIDGNHMPTFYIQTNLHTIALVVAYDPGSPGTFAGLIVGAAHRLANDPEYSGQTIEAVLYASTVQIAPSERQHQEQRERGGTDALLIEQQSLAPGSPRRRRFWFIERDQQGAFTGLREDKTVRPVALDDNPLTIFLMAYAVFHMDVRKVD